MQKLSCAILRAMLCNVHGVSFIWDTEYDILSAQPVRSVCHAAI